MIKESKVGQYVLYAIGEIILVVVGILIAVQIDNWNEDRKKNEQIREVLTQVTTDLATDIERIRWVNEFFLEKDSLIIAYRETHFEEVDSLSENEKSQLYNLIRTYYAFTAHDKGFQLLLSKVDETETQHKNLTEDLSFLYQDATEAIYTHKVGLADMLRDHIDYQMKNFDWYSGNYLYREMSQEELDYYMFDPMYKNFMALYRMHLINIVANGRWFEDVACKIHRQLVIELTGDYQDVEGVWKQAPDNLLQYLDGQFLADTDTISFEVKDQQLITVSEATFRLKSDASYFIYRYMGDSTFYFDPDRNLKISEDGSVYLTAFFDWPSIPLKRIN